MVSAAFRRGDLPGSSDQAFLETGLSRLVWDCLLLLFELVRCEVAQARMGPHAVVVSPPRFSMTTGATFQAFSLVPRHGTSVPRSLDGFPSVNAPRRSFSARSSSSSSVTRRERAGSEAARLARSSRIALIVGFTPGDRRGQEQGRRADEECGKHPTELFEIDWHRNLLRPAQGEYVTQGSTIASPMVPCGLQPTAGPIHLRRSARSR